MNTILQKRIEEAAYEESSTYDLTKIKESNAAYNAAIKAATFILQNQWISVEEALPEVSEYDSYHVMSDHVFATDESLENVIVAWYDNKNKRWYQEWNGGERVQFEITHWMPIPSLEGGEE